MAANCIPIPPATDPAGEYEEMRLKARALLRATGMCDGGEGPAAVEDGAEQQSEGGN